MAKPIRLNQDFMSEVERQAALEHRSVPKQIEYWASLGKIVAKNLRPEDSIALIQGFLKIKLEESNPQDFDMEDVLDELEADQRAGVLANNVTGSAFRYGIDPKDPTRLVRIDANGMEVLDDASFQAGERAIG